MNSNAASSILKEGTIIRTRPGGCTTWYEDVVYYCEGETVCTALKQFYRETLVMPGSAISLKYSNEYFEYHCEGEVVGIYPEKPGYVCIRITSIEELINTRSYPRVETYLSVVLKTSWDEKPKYGIITNISLGGIALISRHDFDYGEESDVSIYLAEDMRIDARGRMIRKSQKNDTYDYSMQFTEIGSSESSLLSDYLTSLEEEWARLQSDFFYQVKPVFKLDPATICI